MDLGTLSTEKNMILITGCAGFIGGALARRLLMTTSATILGIDNLNDYYDVRLKKDRLDCIRREDKRSRFVFISGDISDKRMLFSVFEKYKPSIVIHIAAQAGVRYSIEKPDTYIKSNIIGFFNIA